MSSPIPNYNDVAKRIVRHYGQSKRDLPWRKNRDAYRVWISEIMLQQTRVTAVIPYYERWFASFPTVKDLADAELDEVLAHWSGLGYYSRARNIHASAKELQHSYGGQLPKSANELRALPGIGRYTAGAISSIAYGQQEPLVDGNVARLLSRIFEIEENIKSTPAITKLWQLCTDMVPKSSPGEFNQGLMELGSLTCTPKNPKCEHCPVESICLAHRHKRTADFPVQSKRKADSDKPLLQYDAVFLIRNSKILLGQRQAKGLFGGLWELPQLPSRLDLEELLSLSLAYHRKKPSMVHNQVLSHRRLCIRVWSATATGRTKLTSLASYQSLKWYSLSALPTVGLSSASKTIFQNIAELRAIDKENNQ